MRRKSKLKSKVFMAVLFVLLIFYGVDRKTENVRLYVPSAENHLPDVERKTDGFPDVEVLEVHYIDVGQGDCTLLSCGNQTMLIDCGDSSMGTTIQNYLNKQEIEMIDYLILTHPDADHIGGAPVIITKFDIDQIYMSEYKKDNRTYEKLIQSMEYRQYSWEVPTVSDTLPLGTATVTFVGPVARYDDPNNSSLAVVVRNGNTSFLFSGDAEDLAEFDMVMSGADIDVDVYKVGHHGSSSSSSAVFLSAMAPEYAVISCGEENSYGHPHKEVLAALWSMQIKTFRTDYQGTIIAISDGRSIEWDRSPLIFSTDNT